jgi:DmsE family decaheme c-type cytochrome
MRESRFLFLIAFLSLLLFYSSGRAQPQTGVPQAGDIFVGGAEPCMRCHPKQYQSFAQTKMGPLFLKRPQNDNQARACEACHRPGALHVASSGTLTPGPQMPGPFISFSKSDPASAEERSAVCTQSGCHTQGAVAMWQGSQHEIRGVPCSGCHSIHQPDQKVLSKSTQAEVCFTCHKAQRAQTHRISSHPLAITGLASTAKMTCSDCHNPMGSAGPKLMIKDSFNETCYTCHPERRGPFLWEHAAVVDDCTNCHTPHGSTNAPLLKTRPPWLCQECHSGDHGNQVNSGANLARGNVTTVNGLQQPGAATPRIQLGGRACLNCHVLIHGSNHPAGPKFQR